jgi:hypothetical protein
MRVRRHLERAGEAWHRAELMRSSMTNLLARNSLIHLVRQLVKTSSPSSRVPSNRRAGGIERQQIVSIGE